MDLQREFRKFSDKKVVEALKENHQRVKSMALVNEKLHNSGDMVSVDFANLLELSTNRLY